MSTSAGNGTLPSSSFDKEYLEVFINSFTNLKIIPLIDRNVLFQYYYGISRSNDKNLILKAQNICEEIFSLRKQDKYLIEDAILDRCLDMWYILNGNYYQLANETKNNKYSNQANSWQISLESEVKNEQNNKGIDNVFEKNERDDSNKDRALASEPKLHLKASISNLIVEEVDVCDYIDSEDEEYINMRNSAVLGQDVKEAKSEQLDTCPSDKEIIHDLSNMIVEEVDVSEYIPDNFDLCEYYKSLQQKKRSPTHIKFNFEE
ncbi:hypothetical protein TBLA_0D04890 [Henningerozyma blattae CBS 6284]|uniref:Nucleolar protein SWM2 n=1 Tax=Henningerozyma blattae (strain ATCC 34711 / CBS 6284 / DSM 70876 / NBRC 10599 / NRRL Y-10934 / UCD 77-7) TaxID=1071380 RepID=I2H3N3_HENB6|nr:hypothetical protein TBLA_0D04890 [Tetrapisispora blattae CBS 6284]CCH60985.1 hypothetical protein TBLA_0D04890 [Tetrapisispora blattae CBS 6284]